LPSKLLTSLRAAGHADERRTDGADDRGESFAQ
jgi:hypothetical protein